MKLYIKRDENQVIKAITDYLSECEADELSRMYEEATGLKCSFGEGTYSSEIKAYVLGFDFYVTVVDMEWATEKKDGRMVVGFVPVLESERGEVFAVEAVIPRKGSIIEYKQYDEYKSDTSRVLEYVEMNNADNVFASFVQALENDNTVETYLMQNAPATVKFFDSFAANEGGWMELHDKKDFFCMEVWDRDGKCDEYGNTTPAIGVIDIVCTTDIERGVLRRFETGNLGSFIYLSDFVI